MAEPLMVEKFFINDQKELEQRGPYRQLKHALQYLVDSFPPDKRGLDLHSGGLYTGAVSIAFLFMALSEYYADVNLESKDLERPVPMTAWLTAYIELFKANLNRPKFYDPPTPQECGIHNSVLASLAITAALTKDGELTLNLCSFNKSVLDPDASNEWMFGRAGYLYLLRLVRTSLRPVRDPETGKYPPQSEDDKIVMDALEKTIKYVIIAMMDSPRPWKWGKHYLGAAHGDAGIITQIILTEPHILDDPQLFKDTDADPEVTAKYAEMLLADLGVLLAYQTEDGNWPSSTPGGKTDLVQFCHGAPGIVSSLVSIRDVLYDEDIQLDPSMEDRIDAAISKGRKYVWEKGLLTKEPCLCHGTSGNALALPTPKWPEDEKPAPPNQFEHFLSFTTLSRIEDLDYIKADGKYQASLYGGAAGRAWAWAVADQRLPLRFLGYNDI